LGYKEHELSVLIVDDAQISELNAQYLAKTGPTNVLAFPMGPDNYPGISPQPLGDIVISIETAERESQLADIETAERIDQLLIHGVLHLLGFDHVDSPQRALEMEAKSAELEQLIMNSAQNHQEL